MTGTINRIGKYKVDPSTFGGELTAFDLDGHHTRPTMASKIKASHNFDRHCKRNFQTKSNLSKRPNKESEG